MNNTKPKGTPSKPVRPAPTVGPVQRPLRASLPQTSPTGYTWYGAIPQRLYFAFKILATPFALIGWLLDKAVAAMIVGVAVLVWAWWTKHITDDQVAHVAGEVGTRLLAILSKSGLM